MRRFLKVYLNPVYYPTLAVNNFFKIDTVKTGAHRIYINHLPACLPLRICNKKLVCVLKKPGPYNAGLLHGKQPFKV